jgi:hypothetical protein
MALSSLADEADRPSDEDLGRVLEGAADPWFGLIAGLKSAHPSIEEEWGFRGTKWGWSLRMKLKGRIIVYMNPCAGHFIASFALGEKAVRAAIGASLPSPVMDVINGARKYAEGRGVRIEVRDADGMEAILRLAEIKISN